MCVTPQVMIHLGNEENPNHGHTLAEEETTTENLNADLHSICKFCYYLSYLTPWHIVCQAVHSYSADQEIPFNYGLQYYTGPQTWVDLLERPM
jgi:hypothetical protein